HFRLNDNGDFFVRQQARDSFVKIRDFVFGISVVETEHRRAVLDLRKRLERFSADALSWRIGREETRKLRFEINKLLVEPVVLAVADDKSGVLVIQPVVLADFLSQLRDVFLGFGSVHRSFHETNTRNFGNDRRRHSERSREWSGQGSRDMDGKAGG